LDATDSQQYPSSVDTLNLRHTKQIIVAMMPSLFP
jgi:hypothetical protein